MNPWIVNQVHFPFWNYQADPLYYPFRGTEGQPQSFFPPMNYSPPFPSFSQYQNEPLENQVNPPCEQVLKDESNTSNPVKVEIIPKPDIRGADDFV